MRFGSLDGAAQILLWAEATLLWTLANYVIRDPLNAADELKEQHFWRSGSRWTGVVIARALIAALIVARIASSAGGIWLAALLFVLGMALPLARRHAAVSYCAEIELAFTVLFVASAHRLIAHLGIEAKWGMVSIRASEQRIAALSLVAALGLFVVNGGTYIVRGILSKSGALPKLSKEDAGQSEAGQIDQSEYNRGRLIGALERILLLVVVIAGSYEALAFLVAAKGLIRSKDLENREWAEYFLVGSLASVLVALAAGLIAHYAMQTLQ